MNEPDSSVLQEILRKFRHFVILFIWKQKDCQQTYRLSTV